MDQKWLLYAIFALNGILFSCYLPSMEHYLQGKPSPENSTIIIDQFNQSAHHIQTTSAPPGLGLSEQFYSVVVCIYSVGEIAGGIAFGALADTKFQIKRTLLLACFLGTLSCVLYSVAPNGVAVLFARVGGGLWTGCIGSVGRSYAVKVVPEKDLGYVFSKILSCYTFFMAAGPAFGVVFPYIKFSIWDIRFDEYRNAGWLTALLSLIVFVWMCITMDDPAAERKHPKSYEYERLVTDEKLEKSDDGYTQAKKKVEYAEMMKKMKQTFWNTGRGSSAGIALLLFLFFIVSLGFGMVESMMPLIFDVSFGYDAQTSSLAFSCAGVLLFATSVVLAYLTKPAVIVLEGGKTMTAQRISSRQGIMFALIMLCGSSFLMTDYKAVGGDGCSEYSYDGGVDACLKTSSCTWMPLLHGCDSCTPTCRNTSRGLDLPPFLVGFGMMSIGFTIGRVLITVLFGKLLGRGNNGIMNGYLISSGALARIVAPFYGVNLYQAVGHNTWVLMLSHGGLLFLAIVLTAWLWKEIDEQQNNDEEDAPLLGEKVDFSQYMAH
eukprot:Colp12_sorted_trinity150504_noHs@27448